WIYRPRRGTRSPARPQAPRRAASARPRTRSAPRARERARGARRTRSCSPRASRDLLDVHEERLELGRARVRVADEWRERISEPVLRKLRIAFGRDADEAPVDRDADRVGLAVAGERHRTEPLRDERRDLELASHARDAHPVAVLDALLRGELLGDLDERLRLQTDEQRHVLRHVVLVLGEAI